MCAILLRDRSLIFLVFIVVLGGVARGTEAWCSSSSAPDAAGVFQLPAGSTCTLAAQVVVQDGDTLDLATVAGGTQRAVIEQRSPAEVDDGAHRLFWVRSGTLLLRNLALSGGRLQCYVGSPELCYGALILVGGGTPSDGPARLNLSSSVLSDGQAMGRIDGIFVGNAHGGGLAALGSKTVVHIGTGSEIRNCEADFGGGLAVEKGALAQIVGASLVNNKVSSYNGGAAYVFQGDSKLTAEGTIFINNTANRYGGAVDVFESALFAPADSTFEANTAKHGGAVYAWNLDGAATVHARTSMFRGNMASVSAGGLFVDNVKSLALSSSTFHGNTANLAGGGVVVKRPRNLLVVQSTFKENVLQGNTGSDQGSSVCGNTGSVFGAGMYLADAKDNFAVVIANNTFVNNMAQNPFASFAFHGGGMFVTNIDVAALGPGEVFSFENNIFQDNVAWGQGGGLAVHDVTGPLVLANLHLIHNRASTEGGGLAIMGSSSVVVLGGGDAETRIEGNVAGVSEQRTPGWHAQWWKEFEAPEATLGPSHSFRVEHKPDAETTENSINFASFADSSYKQFPAGFSTDFAAHFAGTLRVALSGTYKFKVQHDQSALLSIDGEPVVSGICCSSPGGSDSEGYDLIQGRPYQISVGYIQRTGSTFYALASWMCVSGDCKDNGGGLYDHYSFIQGSATHGVSSSTYSEPRGGGMFISRTAAANISGLVLMKGNTVNGGNGGACYIDNAAGSRIDGAGTSHAFSGVRVVDNVAKSHTVLLTGGISKVIGAGLGGGLFANVAQIGHANDLFDAAFWNNVPSGIHAVRSAMFLSPGLAKFADPIVSQGFPFPVPICPRGTFFPFGNPDPWRELNVSGATGNQLCRDCSQGRWRDQHTFSPSCQRIPDGEYLDTDLGKILLCSTGSYCEKGVRNACPPGRFSLEGQDSCYPCLIGTYSDRNGSSKCQQCPRGQLQKQTGQDHCVFPSQGRIAIDGTSELIVPDGWQIRDNSAAKPCVAGKVGNTDQSEKDFCRLCPAGMTSYEGSLVCLPCAKGKFSPREGMGACVGCDAGTYQPQEFLPSVECTQCPSGFGTTMNGSAVSCSSLGWITKQDCDDEHWLNDTNLNASTWYCEDCVEGASCKGAINASGIRPLFGWSACPVSLVPLSVDGIPTFAPCLFAAACNGASNPQLFEKFVERVNLNSTGSTTIRDPAKQDFATGSCARPYREGSLLCAGCDADYSRSGLAGGDGRCLQCPTLRDNIMWAAIGLVLAMIMLLVFIRVTIGDAGTLDRADAVKSIGLSFLQVLVLLATFPIAWPDVFVRLFQIGGSITTMGKHLVNIKCMWPAPGYVSEGDVFFGMRLVWGAMPLVLPLSLAVVWWFFARCCTRVENLMEKIKMSIVALLHLLWPAICNETFALFSCSAVCGEMLLRVDLNEKCWEGNHLWYTLCIGLPMLFVWVFGLPAAAFLCVWRIRTKNKMRGDARGALREATGISPHHVYGIFFSMYDNRVWWYEGVVAFRKFAIAAIGVFGGNFVAMQVHITSLLMMFTICVTALVEPYGPKAKVLHYLDMGLLFALWTTLWAASVFNENPRCEDGVGGTLVWCEVLSVVIGLLDVVGVAVFLSLIVYYKTLACRTKVKTILKCLRRTAKSAGGEEDNSISGPAVARVTGDQTMIEMMPVKEVNKDEEKAMVDNPIITKELQQQQMRASK